VRIVLVSGKIRTVRSLMAADGGECRHVLTAHPSRNRLQACCDGLRDEVCEFITRFPVVRHRSSSCLLLVICVSFEDYDRYRLGYSLARGSRLYGRHSAQEHASAILQPLQQGPAAAVDCILQLPSEREVVLSQPLHPVPHVGTVGVLTFQPVSDDPVNL